MTEHEGLIREIADLEEAVRQWTAQIEGRLLGLRRRLQRMESQQHG